MNTHEHACGYCKVPVECDEWDPDYVEHDPYETEDDGYSFGRCDATDVYCAACWEGIAEDILANVAWDLSHSGPAVEVLANAA